MQPEYDQPIADYVRFYAENTPDNIAYIEGTDACTYRTLNTRATQVANGLMAAGVAVGDRVGFLGTNSGAYVEVFFGTCKAKAIYVGLNWRLSPPELAFILNDAGVSIVFCDGQLKSMLNDLQPGVPSLRQIVAVDEPAYPAWRDSQATDDPRLDHDELDPVLQFYTSGTTGKPKGVVLSNRSMGTHRHSEDHWGDWYLTSRGLAHGQQEVIVNAMPNFHVGGLGWLLIGLFRGAKVILMKSPDPEVFLNLIESQRVTHLFAVPVVLGMMVEAQKKNPRDLGSLQVFHYGASSISPTLLKQAMAVMRCRFAQYYGTTETNGTITVLKPEQHDSENAERLQSCGKPIYGVEIKICDADGNEVPRGVAGEIWTKTPSVMLGYWNKPQATAEVLQDGWYRTGDGGRMDADDFVYMADRIKDMIISGGENIYPSEVENALYEHEAVAEVAVIGVPDEKWGEAVKAIVVLANNKRVTPDELILFLRDRLAGYKIPRLYEFVDALPRTPSGKIKKFELRPR